MFGDILNGLPVIGHAKAVVHLVSGDPNNAVKAFYAASRTTAVMVGGAMGIAGGPAGMVAGAAGAGFVADAFASAATLTPHGIIDGATDILVDIVNGEIPTSSVLKTGLYIGADALHGFGGGVLTNMTNLAKEAVLETTVKTACKLVATGSFTRSAAENYDSNSRPYRSSPKSKSKKSSSSKSSSTSRQTSPGNTSGSGSQPPNENDPTFKGAHEAEQDSHLSIFLKIFNVIYLDDVDIGGVHIFVNLKKGQKNSLKKLINQLRMNGYLVRVTETVRIIFNKMNPQDVTFQNFLSLTQFVAAYLGEQVAQRNEKDRSKCSGRFSSYIECREKNANIVSSEISLSNNLLSIFRVLRQQIENCMSVPFRNVFSAIYHYYKHRVVPETGEELSVFQYFGLITAMLHKLRSLKEYAELVDPMNPRRELVYDRVSTSYGRRVRVVLKIQDGQLELSTCYFLDVIFENDVDGDEFIDGNKKKY